ncbi:hypothetical protein ICNINCKA_00081 [Synechococcus sp. CBW1107]|nr:hypothetical protein ICNINCKA_00081 [Synechococcus sp. CBW1107]
MTNSSIGNNMAKRALVSGWFSFPYHHATAGDLLAAELACDWLEDAGFNFDLALDSPFTGGVNWQLVSAEDYSHVVFVCGPFEKTKAIEKFLKRFERSKIIGLNLTMTQPLEQWNPFDNLIERNSSPGSIKDVTRPDMTFLSTRPLVPVVGVCLVEPYGAKYEEQCYEAISRLTSTRELVVVPIDTRLDVVNNTSLCSPAEVESLLARMDAVITTRLHGTVLSLKNGVPVVALDPGGDSVKIKRLAQKIGWPCAFEGSNLSEPELGEALDFCLSPQGRLKAEECRRLAVDMAEDIYILFNNALLSSDALKSVRRQRACSGARSRIGIKIERVLPWRR